MSVALVNPVTRPMYYGVGSRELEGVSKTRPIYLPAGNDWYDFWTLQRYAGGQTLIADAALDTMPLYVRAGAIIPTQDVIQHTGEMPGSPITLNVALGIEPGRTEMSQLHQDAGDGYGYRQSAWRNIRIEHRQGILKITRVGDFDGQQIRYLEVVGMSADPSEVRVDGKKVNRSYDPLTKRGRIELPTNAVEITLVR